MGAVTEGGSVFHCGPDGLAEPGYAGPPGTPWYPGAPGCPGAPG
ncbi:hypothetical protein ACFSTC_41445 [Nonomuraea ferruginea]